MRFLFNISIKLHCHPISRVVIIRSNLKKFSGQNLLCFDTTRSCAKEKIHEKYTSTIMNVQDFLSFFLRKTGCIFIIHRVIK